MIGAYPLFLFLSTHVHTQRRIFMAKNQTVRIKPALLEADRQSYAALQAIADYTPANSAYTIPIIKKAQADLVSAQTTETQTAAAAAAARDDAIAAEWEFHNLMLGAKDQVTAQYGKDSNEVQALGLKKKSEYKAPQRKAPTGNTP